jgi:hypothetical protein
MTAASSKKLRLNDTDRELSDTTFKNKMGRRMRNQRSRINIANQGAVSSPFIAAPGYTNRPRVKRVRKDRSFNQIPSSSNLIPGQVGAGRRRRQRRTKGAGQIGRTKIGDLF